MPLQSLPWQSAVPSHLRRAAALPGQPFQAQPRKELPSALPPWGISGDLARPLLQSTAPAPPSHAVGLEEHQTGLAQMSLWPDSIPFWDLAETVPTQN